MLGYNYNQVSVASQNSGNYRAQNNSPDISKLDNSSQKKKALRNIRSKFSSEDNNTRNNPQTQSAEQSLVSNMKAKINVASNEDIGDPHEEM